MSHLSQRKEKKCLNCNADLYGRYCHVCGQENLEPKESVWHLINHFFSDITHFDGKFFSSLKLLILRPAFLSKEYMIGRRASYLNPIRMYVFTSAIFFLVFFSVVKFTESFTENIPNSNYISTNEINKMDSASFSNFTKEFNNGKPMTRDGYEKYLEYKNEFRFALQSEYHSRKQYDSLLKAGVKKDNWILRQLIYKSFYLNDKYKGDGKAILTNLFEKFNHSIPQMLFVLLPLFALMLKLLYIRQKKFYYVDHAIFAIHFYIFVFLAMMVILGLDAFGKITQWNWIDYINNILVLTIFFYFYKCLKYFYNQSRSKTIFKFFILTIFLSIISLFLFLLFFVFSLYRL